MFAVIISGGKQYIAQEGDVLQVEKLDVEKGQKINFKQVLLIDGEGETLIGTPFVEDAVVKAVVLENFKDKKVIVFKKKRRKQYKKKRGHRQELTRIQIEKIVAGKEKVQEIKPALKKAAAKAETAARTKKTAPEKKAGPAKKATATKAVASTEKSKTKTEKTGSKTKTTTKNKAGVKAVDKTKQPASVKEK
jgi:large subunit ribosomal protein L21